jgi:hypothetical protein
MKIGTLIGIVILAFMVFAGYTYSVVIFASVDEGVNMTGSPYEDQYNATMGVSRASVSFMSFAPMLLAVFVLISALLLFIKII